MSAEARSVQTWTLAGVSGTAFGFSGRQIQESGLVSADSSGSAVTTEATIAMKVSDETGRDRHEVIDTFRLQRIEQPRPSR